MVFNHSLISNKRLWLGMETHASKHQEVETRSEFKPSLGYIVSHPGLHRETLP